MKNSNDSKMQLVMHAIWVWYSFGLFIIPPFHLDKLMFANIPIFSLSMAFMFIVSLFTYPFSVKNYLQTKKQELHNHEQ